MTKYILLVSENTADTSWPWQFSLQSCETRPLQQSALRLALPPTALRSFGKLFITFYLILLNQQQF